LQRGASCLLPAQHGTDSRQEFAKTERLGNVIIGAQFESDHPIDLVTSLAGGDDHRNIRARPDLTQQVEPVFLAESRVEEHEIGFTCGEMMGHLLSPRSGDGAHIVLFKIVADRASDDRVVFDNTDTRRAEARRPIVGPVHAQVQLAEFRGSGSVAPVEIWGKTRTGCFTVHRGTSYREGRGGCPSAAARVW
jgi:hypothetical protein